MATFAKIRNQAAREQSERGAILILTALIMMLLLFIAAFATDLGAWYRQGQAQQQAADVSSLNGMQAYDREYRAFFAKQSPPALNWLDLSVNQRYEAEELAMVAAGNTIVGLLETSGYTFTNNSLQVVKLSPPPNDPTDPDQFSELQIVADDGTVVTIRRSVSVSPDGNNVSAMSVSLEGTGEQYFSGLLRDAPQINTNSTAVLSNCGAECERTFALYPPFAGFDATGSGDGFKPHLFEKDGITFNGYEEVWALNHHITLDSNRLNWKGDPAPSRGAIICMNVETKDSCLGNGAQFEFETWAPELETGNRPVEYFNETTGLMVFAARERNADGTGQTGLACWNSRLRNWCDGGKFVSLFTADEGPTSGWGGFINITGPFHYNNKFYVISQSGEWACASLSGSSGTWDLTANCGSGDTPAAAMDSEMPDLDDRTWYISHGEVIGSKLYMRQPTKQGGGATSDQRFYCLELSGATPTSCWGGDGVTQITDFGYHADGDITFIRHNTSNSPTALCVLWLGSKSNDQNNGDGKHACAPLSGSAGANNPISGFNTFIASMAWGETADGNKTPHAGWGGDSIDWVSDDGGYARTFFAAGSSNKVGCWDWKTSSSGSDCGVLITDNDFTGAVKSNGTDNDWIAPYSFSVVTDDCIIGLSHKSVFFSFDPTGMTNCTATSATTTIAPCPCQDGTSVRWGEVRLPNTILDMVSRMEITATNANDPTDTTLYTNAVDVKANGGLLDLSHVPGTVTLLELNIDVDAILDPNTKQPLWSSKEDIDFKIISKPTLAG